MSMTDNIVDVNTYNSKMIKGIDDKLFFTDIVNDYTQVVDFGCANGALLGKLFKMNENIGLTGYDISKRMLSIARLENPEAAYFSDWDDITVEPNSLLNLSSVIHEVYAYSTVEEIRMFWKTVFNSGFKYISIRDMFVSETLEEKYVDTPIVKKIRSNADWTLASFERMNGSIGVMKYLVHYLLKYTYTDNWERENKENYLPISSEDIIRIIPDRYEVIHVDHFTLPVLQSNVMKTFGFDLQEKTHMKIILKRK